MTDSHAPLALGSRDLRIADVVDVARDGRPVELAPGVAERISAGRAALEEVAAHDSPTYGVNTGFGHLSSVRIAPADQEALQLNLIRSHACAVGDPLDEETVRGMLLLLANSLAKGHSGVRVELVRAVLGLLNAGVTPWVPSRGSVGASGDLAPMAHIGLTLIGEGHVVDEHGAPAETAEVLAEAGLRPIQPASKEGLAILNGTHLMAAMGALAVADLERLLTASECAAAVSIEALLGSHRPFDARIHELRRQPGQIAVAKRLRRRLAGSQIVESHANCARVQDPYSFRAVPQVLGAVADTIAHAHAVIERELDAVTDNPLVFADGERPEALSGGNFHGQPLSIVLDLLAIALAELAAFSERRTYALLSPGPANLPAFLAASPGLESGLMILQYVAASLVAELGVLSSPAGPRSLPTSAGMEDFNSMGATAALKLRQGLELAARVVAIELICGAQGLEAHRPMRSGVGVEDIVGLVRNLVPPVEHDRSTSEEIEHLAWAVLSEGLLDES